MKKFIVGLVCGVTISGIVSVCAIGTYENIDVLRNNINVIVDGNKVTADNFLYNDTTYLPLRAVSEALGKDVKYDEITDTATITSKVVTGTKNTGSNSHNIPTEEDKKLGEIQATGDTYVVDTSFIFNKLKQYEIEINYDDNTDEYLFSKNNVEIFRCKGSASCNRLTYDDVLDVIIPAIKVKLGM